MQSESPHESGAHIDEQMKANARVTYQITANESKSARRWAENLLESGEHRHTRRKQLKVKQSTNMRASVHNTSQTKQELAQ
jgi:hypothetical protein